MERKRTTRKDTLARCLEHLQRLTKMVSKDHKGLEPINKEAAEDFYELTEQCRILREVIQDYECPEVVEAAARWRNPAKWQEEHMRDPEGSIRRAMDFTFQ